MIQIPDPEESGIYPIIDKKIDKSKSFAFMSEHSNLFYIRAESMSAQQFGKISDYEKWHSTGGWAILPTEIFIVLLFRMSQDWKNLSRSPTISTHNEHPA
jgi:hypothetical protein